MSTEKKLKSSLEEKINKKAEEAGLDISYEPIVLETFIMWKYSPDFVLKTKKGNFIVIEAKGDMLHFSSDYRKKWVSMYKKYSGKYDIRFIFQADRKIPHCKKMTCSKWAERHGIKYHIGEEIPLEWSEE